MHSKSDNIEIMIRHKSGFDIKSSFARRSVSRLIKPGDKAKEF